MLQGLVEQLFGGGWDGADRRLSMRAKCDIEVEVACPGLRFLGRVTDAGPTGMRISIRGATSSRVVKKGAVLDIKHLNPGMGVDRDTVRCKIAWVKKIAENIFDVGVSLDEPVENLKRSWIKPLLVKSLEQKTQQKRKHLRVRANIKSVLNVDGKHTDVNVRDLSVGGCKVESFQSLAGGTHVKVLLKPGKTHEELLLPGMVRRSVKSLGAYDVGVAFLLDAKLKKQLLKLIKGILDLQKQTRL